MCVLLVLILSLVQSSGRGFNLGEIVDDRDPPIGDADIGDPARSTRAIDNRPATDDQIDFFGCVCHGNFQSMAQPPSTGRSTPVIRACVMSATTQGWEMVWPWPMGSALSS